MRIRTQLILAAFLLAVVPLAAIVTYSHHSSKRALESAYRREADRMTRQMDRRLAAIRTDLDQRLTVVSALPMSGGAEEGDARNIATVMGDAAALVDALEFHPVHRTRVEVVSQAEPAPPTRAADEPPPAPPPPPVPPSEPLVIELPPMPEMPRFVMSEEQRELIVEISALATRMTKPALSGDEREDIRKEMHEAQQELRQVVASDRKSYQSQMEQARRAMQARQRQVAAANRAQAEPAPPVPAATPPPPRVKARVAPTPRVREATPNDAVRSAASAEKTSLILGRRFAAPVHQEGEVVGQLTARVSHEQVIRRILGTATEDGSEIPFAIDRKGTLYTRTAEARTQLQRLGIAQRAARGQSMRGIDGWIVSMSTDPQSGLRIGVARPVGENLQELRRAAARNFGLGLGLIAFALIGIIPFSNHLTRDVKRVTNGAERIAHGDLMTRLPVKTNNELGQLARAFNQMAEDLSIHQQKLLEQERARRDQEVQQRLMSVEYERKSDELEDARRFQLSMLPKQVPQHPGLEVAVFTRTATEVGGDYYDFHVDGDVLSVTIGDATGHGAKAGTMVTVVKTLFSGYEVGVEPSAFLEKAAETIKRMDLGRMSMALSLARIEGERMTIAAAGMPPVLIHRARRGDVEEIALPATPLGTLGTDYHQKQVGIGGGDTVLFMTDGFPELMNAAGQQLGYTGAAEAFTAAARGATADAVIASLAETAQRWHGGHAPDDDVTFVVVRVV